MSIAKFREDSNIMIENYFSKIASGDAYAIALCITVFCAIACIYSLYFQYRVWNWPSVWGKLLEADVEKIGGTDLVKSEQDYAANVGYTYTVKGRSYTGNRLSAMSVMASHNAQAVLHKQLKGIEVNSGKVRVYYNPFRPSKSFLIRGSGYQVTFTILMLAGTVVVSMRLLQLQNYL